MCTGRVAQGANRYMYRARSAGNMLQILTLELGLQSQRYPQKILKGATRPAQRFFGQVFQTGRSSAEISETGRGRRCRRSTLIGRP